MSQPPVTVTKLHGLGNDFLVALEPAGPLDAAFARRACDRHRGVGADGLIVGRRAPEGSGALLTFQLWNADGSEAEMSGNGMRCLAHAALDAGWVPEGSPFGVLTAAGRREVTIRRTGNPGEAWATVEMGAVKIHGPAERGGVGERQLLVDVGNPHLVVAVPDPAGVDVAAVGPQLEATEPGGLNVELAALGPGPDEVTMRVWERGVGETEACGTGSCAVAAAFHHWGRVGPRVTVYQPGGPVAVDVGRDATTLTGPSCRVAACTVG